MRRENSYSIVDDNFVKLVFSDYNNILIESWSGIGYDLHEQFDNYLIEELYSSKKCDSIHLCFSSLRNISKEKTLMSVLYHHYQIKLEEKKQLLLDSIKSLILMFVIGFLSCVIVVKLLLLNLITFSILFTTELFKVSTWMFLWTALYFVFFELKDKYFSYIMFRKILKLMSKVTFHNACLTK